MSYTEISSTTQVAKKPHRCFGCWGIIHPGDTYRRDAGVFDGEFQVTKFCPLCLEILPEFEKFMVQEWGNSYEYAEGDIGVFRQEFESQKEEALQ